MHNLKVRILQRVHIKLPANFIHLKRAKIKIKLFKDNLWLDLITNKVTFQRPQLNLDKNYKLPTQTTKI